MTRQAITANTTYDVPLNATGLSWISKTGWTKLGIREGAQEVDNPGTPSTHWYFDLNTSKVTTEAYKPYLEVTYTTSSITDIFYAGGANAKDGVMCLYSKNESWTLLRAEAEADAVYQNETGNSDMTVVHATSTTNCYDQNYRAFFGFDTSSLTADAIITAATFTVYLIPNSDTGGGSVLNLTGYSPASNTNIVKGDYDSFDDIKRTNGLAYSSISANAYNTFTLNASGLSYIKKTGVTNFMMRLEIDIDNSSLSWASGRTWGSVGARYSPYTGTGSDPYLIVTYAVPTIKKVGGINWN
jgi:hypothetical protein